MLTAMRKGEFLCINIEDKIFDFLFYSHDDDFPCNTIFDDDNLKDIDDICYSGDRFCKNNKKISEFKVDPRFRLVIVTTCKDEDLVKVLEKIPHVNKWHKLRICI